MHACALSLVVVKSLENPENTVLCIEQHLSSVYQRGEESFMENAEKRVLLQNPVLHENMGSRKASLCE